MLTGSQPFIDEARIWLRRHGGNHVTQFPIAAIAEQSFDDRIGRMRDYRDAALRVARALELYPQVVIRPQPPPTNMLHVFFPGSADEFMNRAQRIARAHGIWTIQRLASAGVPDLLRWDIACGDATVATP
jgi:threonine aldolase